MSSEKKLRCLSKLGPKAFKVKRKKNSHASFHCIYELKVFPWFHIFRLFLSLCFCGLIVDRYSDNDFNDIALTF